MGRVASLWTVEPRPPRFSDAGPSFLRFRFFSSCTRAELVVAEATQRSSICGAHSPRGYLGLLEGGLSWHRPGAAEEDHLPNSSEPAAQFNLRLLEGPLPRAGPPQLPMDPPGFSCDHPFEQALLV